MHNKDVIFAANAQSVEITKFTTALNALLSPAITAISVGINVETWRILSQTHPGGASSTVVTPPVVVPPTPAP